MVLTDKKTLQLELGILVEPFAVSLTRFTADGRGGVARALRMVEVRRGWSRRADEDGEGEGGGEGAKVVVVEEGGRCSLRICIDLDIGRTGVALSSPSHHSGVASLVVSASARIFRILWINLSVCRVPSMTNSAKDLRYSRVLAVASTKGISK